MRWAFLCGEDAVSGKSFEHRKAWYNGASSSVSFDAICKKLRERFHLPEFEEEREDNWVYGYAENGELGINITWADDFMTIDKWIPNSPLGINYQFVVYADNGAEKILSLLKNHFAVDATLAPASAAPEDLLSQSGEYYGNL